MDSSISIEFILYQPDSYDSSLNSHFLHFLADLVNRVDNYRNTEQDLFPTVESEESLQMLKKKSRQHWKLLCKAEKA